MITLKNNQNGFVKNGSNKIIVTVLDNLIEHVHVKPIKEVGDGEYETSFTIIRYGYYTISVTVDGHHIPSTPYKYVIINKYVYMYIHNLICVHT